MTAVGMYELRSEWEREAVHHLRDDAEEWLRGLGEDQFQPDGPSQAWRAHDLIDEAFDRGEFVGLYMGPALVAVGAIKDPDHDFWTSAERAQPQAYVARFLVANHGNGWGRLLLAEVGIWARRAGLPVMRLDCWRTNERLQTYYKRLGFRHLRTVEVEGRGSGALFELDLTRPSPLLP